MNTSDDTLNSEILKLHSKNCNYFNVFNRTGVVPTGTEFIRFEEKREQYSWVHPDEIYFIKSADHYVTALIKCGNQLKWMTRHSTLKEMVNILPEDFIRLNRFYLVNLNYFSHISENKKLLFLINNFSIPVPHRISAFLCHLQKTGVGEMSLAK